MKILIGCPTCGKYEYCIDLWIEAVNKIIKFSKDHQIDYLLVDNSEGNEFFEKLKSKGANVIKSGHDKDVRERIVNSRNLLRNEALNKGYDYFFSLESDIIPKEDIMSRLLSHKKQIVSAYYGKQQELLVQDKETKEVKKIKIEIPIVWLKEEKGIRRAFPQEVLNKGLSKEIWAFGMGCLLISNEVLEKIKFRFEKGKKAYDDIFFCMDAKNLGYELFLDSSVKAAHLWKDWEKENL